MKSDAPVPCDRGFYASEGSMSCDECPVGFYCPLLVTPSPQPCASGFYANETSSANCTECDRGKLFIVLFIYCKVFIYCKLFIVLFVDFVYGKALTLDLGGWARHTGVP